MNIRVSTVVSGRSPLTVVGLFGTQANYDLSIGVDPSNPQAVYLGGEKICFESVNGGGQWRTLNFPGNGLFAPHTDQHAWAFANGVAYDANDGGVYKLRGGTWVDMNSTVGALGTIQVASVASTGADVNQLVLEGSQDNGVALKTAAGGTAWSTVQGGDGGEVQYAPASTSIAFGVSNGARYWKRHE